MEFFSDGGFSRICPNERCFHWQENRKRNQFRFRVNSIAKSDVDLHRNAGSGQIGQEFDAHAIVLVFLLDFGALDRLVVENNAVFVLNFADGPDSRFNFFDGGG